MRSVGTAAGCSGVTIVIVVTRITATITRGATITGGRLTNVIATAAIHTGSGIAGHPVRAATGARAVAVVWAQAAGGGLVPVAPRSIHGRGRVAPHAVVTAGTLPGPLVKVRAMRRIEALARECGASRGAQGGHLSQLEVAVGEAAGAAAVGRGAAE